MAEERVEDFSYAVQVALLAARSAVRDGRDVGPNTASVLIAEIDRLTATNDVEVEDG